ncbi:MAG: outer membrane protein assembly factor BamD [Anderseniella sp.]|nr:outer membrane protein assembly factor BamD [Anderseniella sp.]
MPQLTKSRSLAALGLAGLLLAGCSGGTSSLLSGDGDGFAAKIFGSGNAVAPDLGTDPDGEPIARMYNEGVSDMQSGQYRSAVKKFSEVERQHPYSKWATKAILMQAYAQYQRNAYPESIAAAERFIQLHPGHRDAAYAQYLIALCHYEQIGDIRRDPTAARKSLAELEEVARRYPDTPYAQDAMGKANLARDVLAGKEMEVGRYYQRKKAHLAAINRYKTVVEKYQTSSHTPEALYRLTENYLQLGVRSEAQTAAAVLGHNYPNSQWYKDAFSLLQGGGLSPQVDSGSWLSGIFGS